MRFYSQDLGRERHADLLREAAAQRFVGEAPRASRRTAPRSLGAWLDRRAGRRLATPTERRGAYVDRLEAAPLFRGLSKRHLATIASHAELVRFPAGTVIAHEQQPRAGFVVLARGAAEATIAGRRVSVLAAGDHFGELTMTVGAAQSPTVTALTDIEAYEFGPRDFWSVMHTVPGLAIRLAAHTQETLRRAEVAREDTPTRVISLDASLNHDVPA